MNAIASSGEASTSIGQRGFPVDEGSFPVVRIPTRFSGRDRFRDYRGENFRAIFPNGEEALIYRNIDGDEPAEPDHANCHVLLQVDRIADLDMWNAFALDQNGTEIRVDSSSWSPMMQDTSPIEILKSLGLLSWTALAVGWERRWVTKESLGNYATYQLQSDISEADLAATATVASAEQLDAAEITRLLAQLAGRSPEGKERALEKWRLARLIELQSEQLHWDEKVTRLEELGAEFGYPRDMRLCSRYVTGDQAPNSDPLDAMVDVISELRRRLGVG